MSNIWKENQNVKENPNRNTFDLSFQNHLTMKLGTLYPVFCKEVNPGDSFRIKTAFGLKFMPMVFPIQSKMKAYMHFFYVRNKNIWENWENFISGLETHTHPFIDQPSSFFKTGSLSDYLDVPTTLVRLGNKSIAVGQSLHNLYGGINSRSRVGSDPSGSGRSTSDSSPADSGRVTSSPTETDESYVSLGLFSLNCASKPVANDTLLDVLETNNWDQSLPVYGMYLYDCPLQPLLRDDDPVNPSLFSFNFTRPVSTSTSLNAWLCFWRVPVGADITSNFNRNRTLYDSGYGDTTIEERDTYGNIVCVGRSAGTLVDRSQGNCLTFTPTDVSSYIDLVANCADIQSGSSTGQRYNIYVSFVFAYDYNSSNANITIFPLPGQFASKHNNIQMNGNFSYWTQRVVDSEPTITPFGNDANNGLHINALPYRAYESCYNAWYRNTQNQPMYVNGVEVFNKYNTTLADGADSTDYHLFQRNYEMDFLTSAMPSPQFGNAPLVGLNPISGTITLEDDSVIKYEAGLDSGDLSKTRLSFTSSDGSTVATTDIPQLGMAISDFRGVNALQHFLEMTLRHGYKYRDFIEGHFGSAPKDQVLDMPEFIGGVSQPVTIGQITNMSPTDSMPLGAFGGQANCFGASQNDITHYCDDFGWIIGIMSIVPEPAYSQLLPKHFLHDSQLDYYFPEFAQLGLQSIDYREVCPIQKYDEVSHGSPGSLVDTFGYQRPNYDLVAYTNQVHGLFRTQLSNYLFNRKFSVSPQLSSSFLEINPAELNDVFVITDPQDDVVTGQIIFDVVAKRPVPRVNVPSLGR